MANRLAHESSPYLRQHAENPVDWWPWGREAFEEARRRDVPVLISIGYSSCHWCHVMNRESFQDPHTANVINATCVPVKVDREELPAVDAIYMSALQAMRGQGGWPLTAWADHDGRPFYAGTYFPPRPVQNQPSFEQVLRAIDETWRHRRDEVSGIAGSLTERIAQQSRIAEARTPDGQALPVPGETELQAAAEQLLDQIDLEHGGFGPAPKFPPPMTLIQLLRHHARTAETGQRSDSLDVVALTMRQMAAGGIHDHLTGGFARYSVDREWVVPHFEKMLYDNALILRAAVDWWRAENELDPGSGNADLARYLIEQTAGFLTSGFRLDCGAFAASFDADSELPAACEDEGEAHRGNTPPHGEGAFAVWSRHDLDEALGADAGWAAEFLAVTEEGTFEHGRSVLQMPALRDLDGPGDQRAGTRPWQNPRWLSVRDRLLAARERRPQPARDDKVLTSWNALAVTALTHAAQALQRPDWMQTARDAQSYLLRTHWRQGLLARASLEGSIGGDGVLEDYAALAVSAATLYSAEGDPGHLRTAREVIAAALERFVETGEDGDGTNRIFDAPDDGLLVVRTSDSNDTAVPSGRALLAEAAGMLAGLLSADDPLTVRLAALREDALRGFLIFALKAPRGGSWGLAQAETRAAGDPRLASRSPALRRLGWEAPSPGLLIDPEPEELPEEERRAAVICRDRTCGLPITEPEALAAALRGSA
ncbi:thioredoxin domain-containing protein [Sediminivirga luteola]|uniref:Thioredoxin domain-containing protein n=1 Tax=Sediminivirga luteola TaxID=1774748 RepID=A0A8J2TW77_9MICO|nr:thioredoxin domain-containing protein [Sediminivirga luteola]GGA05965.1 thioredoxin domain-containing protein [Sediminivirga luteola]